MLSFPKAKLKQKFSTDRYVEIEIFDKQVLVTHEFAKYL